MKCPGQDSRYWDQHAIFEAQCPKCGAAVEFFKDDSSRRCSHCGERMANPQTDFGCAAYCPYAEQCLGSLPEGLRSGSEELLKDRVAVEMKRYFGDDFRRIGHAAKVARYAEEICKGESANPAVVLVAAYLHDIGIKESERRYNSSAPKYQHREGPPVARMILEKLNAEENLINEVCDIIGHHHWPREDETMNFKVLYDADLITNLEEEHAQGKFSRERLGNIVSSSFLTRTGAELAKKVLLAGEPSGNRSATAQGETHEAQTQDH